MIDESLVQSDEDRQRLADLESQGHEIIISTFPVNILMAPNAWRAFDLKYIDLAIKSARSVKYGKSKATTRTKKLHVTRKKKGGEGPKQPE